MDCNFDCTCCSDMRCLGEPSETMEPVEDEGSDTTTREEMASCGVPSVVLDDVYGVED